jgi:hypothetical protein
MTNLADWPRPGWAEFGFGLDLRRGKVKRRDGTEPVGVESVAERRAAGPDGSRGGAATSARFDDWNGQRRAGWRGRPLSWKETKGALVAAGKFSGLFAPFKITSSGLRGGFPGVCR